MHVEDPGLNARLEELGEVSWNKSFLKDTRCPFLRAAAAAGALNIENGNNLQSKSVLIATIDSVNKAGRGLGSVLTFFAGFNHTRGLHAGQDTQFEGLKKSTFNLDQSTDRNTSDGTHDGGVEIIRSVTGIFNPPVVAKIKEIAGDSPVLTPETMAKVIIVSNSATFSDVSGNTRGTVLDLAKSAGEWALMFCLLKDQEDNVLIADLEALCRDARVPQRGAVNLERSSTPEWVQYTSVITAHIVQEKPGAFQVIDAMHATWSKANGGPGCGCAICTQGDPEFWHKAGQPVRTAIARFGGNFSGRFAF